MKPRKWEDERRAVQLILTWQGRYLWFFLVRGRSPNLDPELGRSACPPPCFLLPLFRGVLKYCRSKMAEVIEVNSRQFEEDMEMNRGLGVFGRPASRIPIDGRERRNVVRLELKDGQMDRGDFSKEVLQKTLRFSPGEIDYLFAFPGKTTFEVVFKSRALYDKCLRTVEREKLVNPVLEKFLIVPLSDRMDKRVNILMFTEKVKLQDISTWLLQFCDVKTSMQMTDEDGIKNGLYKFDVILKKENDTERVIHLPAVIQIGTVRGHVFYSGQPQVCRRCGNEGHKAAECGIIKCRNCKEEGHSTRECRKPIKCNLCGQEEHVFRDCPASYANMVRRNTMREKKVIALLDEESEEEREMEDIAREGIQGSDTREREKIDPLNIGVNSKRESEQGEREDRGETDLLALIEEKTDARNIESRMEQHSQNILFHTEEIMDILSGTTFWSVPQQVRKENIEQEEGKGNIEATQINPGLQRKRGPDNLSPTSSGKSEGAGEKPKEWGTAPCYLESKDMEGFVSATGMKGVEEWRTEKKVAKKPKKYVTPEVRER
ncbi:ZCHC3 protein, partial [Polypterus senegalus]